MSELSFSQSYKLKTYFKVDEQVTFIRIFNSYMNSEHLSVTDSLEKVRELYLSQFDHDYIVVQICDELLVAVVSGDGYQSVMEKYFDMRLSVGFALAQTVSVNKKDVERVAELVNIERDIKKQTFNKIATPLFLNVLAIIAASVTGKFILPILEKAAEPVGNSIARMSTMFFSSAIFDYWWLILISSIFLYFGYNRLQNNWIGAGRSIADQVFPFSNYRDMWGIRIMQLFGLLKKSGKPEIEALELIHTFSSPYAKFHITELIDVIDGGSEKKGRFLNGLLSPAQRLRLDSYLDVSDELFIQGLLDTASESVLDIQTYNSKVISRWVLFLYSTAMLIMGGAFLAVIDLSAGMILQN